MRAKVTEQGVLIPKQWFEGVDEVEIRQEQSVIVVVPVTDGDPIWELGADPVMIDVEDASVNHDRYLYDS
ncbi:MAG: hypothetical protein U0641_19575 [Anaerolineae bacterium]